MTPLVPGGLQWTKENAKAGPIANHRPYGRLWVTLEGRPEFTTGLSYIQRYLVRCIVACGSDNTVLRAVDAALDSLLTVTTKFESATAGAFLTENAQTVHVELVPGGLDQEQYRAAQQNVGVVERFWRVSLNETRSAP